MRAHDGLADIAADVDRVRRVRLCAGRKIGASNNQFSTGDSDRRARHNKVSTKNATGQQEIVRLVQGKQKTGKQETIS